jgi:hypothetical protein
MGSTADQSLDQARRLLRNSARGGADAILGSATARALLDELQRLTQSCDRLRRQNRRVRRRLAQHGLADDELTVEGDLEEASPPAE